MAAFVANNLPLVATSIFYDQIAKNNEKAPNHRAFSVAPIRPASGSHVEGQALEPEDPDTLVRIRVRHGVGRCWVKEANPRHLRRLPRGGPARTAHSRRRGPLAFEENVPLLRVPGDPSAARLHRGARARHQLRRGRRASDRPRRPGPRTPPAGRDATELASHWRGEETGLFRVLAREEMFAEHIAPLVREHRELGELLATVDIRTPEGQQAIRDAVFDPTSTSPRRRTGFSRPR
jgi:hypothetical protein